MRHILGFMMVFSVILWSASFVSAGEHGGKEQSKEHGGTAQKERGGVSAPSADAIRTAMKNYVMEQSNATGTFDVADPETGKMRKLEFLQVHERVGKTGNYYYSCADFKDTETDQMLDLDLDVQNQGGVLSVADVRIHKVAGKERYTYDANDNRIPMKAESGHEGHEHGGKEQSKEHGGTAQKEHGGN